MSFQTLSERLTAMRRELDCTDAMLAARLDESIKCADALAARLAKLEGAEQGATPPECCVGCGKPLDYYDGVICPACVELMKAPVDPAPEPVVYRDNKRQAMDVGMWARPGTGQPGRIVKLFTDPCSVCHCPDGTVHQYFNTDNSGMDWRCDWATLIPAPAPVPEPVGRDVNRTPYYENDIMRAGPYEVVNHPGGWTSLFYTAGPDGISRNGDYSLEPGMSVLWELGPNHPKENPNA